MGKELNKNAKGRVQSDCQVTNLLLPAVFGVGGRRMQQYDVV